MSQHNITGSEAFGKKPMVMLRSVKSGAMRRKRTARMWVAFAAGVVVAVIVGALITAAVASPTTFG